MQKKLIAVLSAAFFNFSFLIFNSHAQAPKKMPLDGQVFVAEIIKEGKKKPLDPDELKFSAGKFKSVLFADWGFTKASKYEIISIDSTSSDVKIYSWTAETINDIEEKMMWSGTIKGEEIEGTSELVNKKGETKYNYTFTGKLKKKPGKKG